MKLLLTGTELPVPEIAARLCDSHVLERVDLLPYSAGAHADLVAGCQAIIHAGAWLPGLGEQDALDLAGRRTYDLCQAARQAGVEHVILLSTLDLFRHYPENCRVSEQWQPRPPSDLRPLCLYLAELTCCEFSRIGAFRVTCLRMGPVVREENVQGQEPDLAWVDERDAARAVQAALDLPADVRHGHWLTFHVTGRFPNPRFAAGWTRRFLGCEPQHAFGASGEKET